MYNSHTSIESDTQSHTNTLTLALCYRKTHNLKPKRTNSRFSHFVFELAFMIYASFRHYVPTYNWILLDGIYKSILH